MRGCDGLYPQRMRGQDAPPRPEDEAINVAIVGKPNAGKSSLLNAMIGEDRVIVSDIPGTTTDAIDAYLEADNGKVYRFVDTAGIRRKGRINAGTEWLSVNRAIKAVKRCDVALMVLDASEIMTGKQSLGNAYWCPDQQQRWIARQIEEKGAACVVVLSKWDAVPNKDEKTQLKFVQAIRSNLSGVGQWAEIVTVSSRTGQRMGKVLDAINKTMEAHKKRIPTPVLNEVVRDALLWKLPAAMAHNKKQGRIYYAVQVSAEPPQIALFCNNPKLFNANYKTYLENKLRQDLGWFGTPIQLEWRKRSERRAVSTAESWLGPRLQPSEPVFQPR
jgi:GTP-binding protein